MPSTLHTAPNGVFYFVPKTVIVLVAVHVVVPPYLYRAGPKPVAHGGVKALPVLFYVVLRTALLVKVAVNVQLPSSLPAPVQAVYRVHSVPVRPVFMPAVVGSVVEMPRSPVSCKLKCRAKRALPAPHVVRVLVPELFLWRLFLMPLFVYPFYTGPY